MAAAMRVVGDEEGEGSKEMALATMVAGKQMVMATKRAMAMKTREPGEEDGTGKGDKSKCNGEEDGNGQQ